jgi:transposase
MAQLASAGINITIKQQNQTTSVRRGHRCVTNLLCAENCSLLLMVERAEALGAFAKALREHGGDPSQIEAIAMDMSPAYAKGATEHFPQARIVNNLAAVLKCSARRSRGYIFTWDLSKNRRF